MHCLGISRDFIAQHFLIGGDWGSENLLHSHHYRLEVRIEGADLDNHGYLIDILDLERILADLIGRYRDRTLNDLPEFEGLNPSIERFSRILWEAIRGRLSVPGRRLTVRLWENATDWAGYTE